MPVFDTYHASKAGPTGTLAFNALTATALEVLARNQIQGPICLMLMSTENVYLKQGDSTVVATSDDFLLVANIYFPMLIESTQDNHLSALGESGAGTIYITTTSDITTQPGSV